MNAKPREEWLQTLSLKLAVELFARRGRVADWVRSRTPSRRHQ
jgi:hypothetical protein